MRRRSPPRVQPIPKRNFVAAWVHVDHDDRLRLAEISPLVIGLRQVGDPTAGKKVHLDETPVLAFIARFVCRAPTKKINRPSPLIL
jgi:hypothetical protein